MAIVKKYNPSKIYLSKRIKDKLSSIFDHKLTIVEAPIGYGKSTIVKEFLKNTSNEIVWFNIDSDDKEQFLYDFAARLKNISKTAAEELLKAGFPRDAYTASRVASILMDIPFEKPTIIVLDNCHYIMDKNIITILKDIANKNQNILTLICICKEIYDRDAIELALYGKINYIEKKDFAFKKEEIDEYYKQCGVKLEKAELDFLFKYSEGWLSALYLQLVNFEKTKSFEQSINAYSLVEKSVWDDLTVEEQEFLVSMSVYPKFTARQAAILSKDCQITDECRKKLLDNNGFIIYDEKEKNYRFHPMLKEFVNNELNNLETIFKKKLYSVAGNWYAANDNMFTAMKYFKEIDDYESILALDWSKENISGKLTRANKDMFMDVVLNTSYDIKKKYKRNYLVFVYGLFILNERAYFKKECDFIRECVLSMENITNIERNDILGEVEFMYALSHYNDIEKMTESYKKAFEYLKAPSRLFRGNITFNFDCPSVLSLFHRKPGDLKAELDALDEMMPYYYKLTEGDFKGIESLMRAEAMYNQGNIKEAMLLCEKAKYMAETRAQTNVYISVLLLQARIAIFDADYDTINKYMNDIREISLENNRYMLTYMSDLCRSCISSALNDVENISYWLKDSAGIENRATILNLGYANILYANYLLNTKDYDKLLAIGEEMLEIAGIFSNIMYKIYTYIFMAIASYECSNTKKALEYLVEAIILSIEDDIVMPFVEYYSGLESLMDRIYVQKDMKVYKTFIDKVKMFIKKYNRGINSINKASRIDRSYGLTKRELDVAKLAAQRYTNKEIADMLFIAESTVKSNLKIIFNKMSINSRSQLKDYFG